MTRDDISITTGATNSTTFIGVIDVVDSAARRASMMKKSIANSARHLKDELKHEIKPLNTKLGSLKKFNSERKPSSGSGLNSNNSVWGSSEHSELPYLNPFDSDDEEEEEERMPPSPAKGLANKLEPLSTPGSTGEGGSKSGWETGSRGWDEGSKTSKTGSKSSKTSKDSKPKKKWGKKSVTKDHAAVIESEEKQRADALEREARKERVKEKLEKYKSDRRTLRSNCATLEAQLIETAEKLREVDSKAAYKIDSLEAELEKTKEGMESLVMHSTKEVTDQSACIKTLGKKLIRQAHVIKQQKKAVEEYQIQLEALREEMAMQDERDSSRDDEYNDLKEDFERTLQQKVAMQDSLQESIEEMMDLRHERDMHTARIRELELTLQEKEIDLERAKRENGELNERVTKLETELMDKTDEFEVVNSKLMASVQSVDVFKSQLAASTLEIEDLKEKTDALSSSQHRGTSFRWMRGSSANNVDDDTTMEERLQAKEMQIQALDQAAKEAEETIKSLRSDMVKMSSTFKQDDYLKRKQITKLKQDNAEYALKLRALEKAFKGVAADTSLTSSLHAKSMHASTTTKSDMAQAVKARLGSGSLAPYEFPSPEHTSETWSDEGRKGEWPEEC
jgi:myosin heavy subunit